MSQVYPQAENHYRVAGPFVEHNFGLIEIDWDANPDPMIHLKALGVDGGVGFSHSVSLSNLH